MWTKNSAFALVASPAACALAFSLLLALLAMAAILYRRQRLASQYALAEREQCIAQTRDFLNQIVNAIADPVFVTDQAHRWVMVNRAFCEIHGLPREGFIGKSAHEVFSQSIAQSMWEGDERVLSADIDSITEGELTDGQGVTHIVVTKKTSYTDAMGRRFVVGIISDISERKAMEAEIITRVQEFRTLAENSPDPIYRYDRDCRRLYVNPVVGKITGKPVAELIGGTPADGQILVSDQNQKLMNTIRTVFNNGESDELDLDFIAQDGRHRAYQMLLVPERDAGGQVMTVLAMARDVTQTKRIENSLRRSRDVVRALAAHQETERETERRQLAYAIHEDLAQNLAALRLNLASLEAGGDAVTFAPVLQTVQGIVDRSIARIRDLVSTLRPSVLDLGLASTLHWLTDDFRGVGLAFDLDVQEDIALSDEATTFLYRAANEALLNIALHAAATRVHVSLAETSDTCRLVVRDNGCGFDTTVPCVEGRFGLVWLAEGALHLGGELLVDSTTDGGTTLEVRVACRSE